jgi:hypothetical protein
VGRNTYNRAGGLVAYNTTSDRRLKENIRDSDDSGSIIDALRVRAFDWRDALNSRQRYWLVAQEVAEVMPEVVSVPAKEEEFWSIDVSKFVPLMIKELQQLRSRVAILESSAAAIGK